MNLFDKSLDVIKKFPYWIGALIGFIFMGCIFYPDAFSAIATWIGMVGGLIVIYQGLIEFEFSRKKFLEVIIDFPYESAFSDRGETMPFMNDTSFFSGRFINVGMRKIILIDGGIRTLNNIEEPYDPDNQDPGFIGDNLDGSSFGGVEFRFPCEISPDESIEFKKSREENLNNDILLNPDYKYVVVWVKEASGKIFYNIIETPYYHDKMSSES